ncbi:MAG: flagellar filament capping protein FliD [Pseudomonadota bacterium]|nr:flagellar filament capping protein FliD [Pseudomonadota bacterium]
MSVNGSDILSALNAGSGINAKNLVDQLVAAERAPRESMINEKIESATADISGYGQLSASLSALRSATGDLKDQRDFAGTLVTTESNAVSYQVTDVTQVGTYAIEVNSLAQRRQVVSGGYAAATTTIGSGSAITVSITVGGTTQEIEVDDPTPQAVVDAVNAAGGSVTARLVDDGSGSNAFKVILSGGLGTDNNFTVSSSDGALSFGSQLTAAADASITIDGLTITRPNNTLDDVLPGLTMTLNAPTSSAESVTVSRDTSGVENAIVSFVDVLNASLDLMDTLGASGIEEGEEAGALNNDSTLRFVESQIKALLLADSSTPGTSLSNLNDLGVTFNREGRMEVDAATLRSALSDNFDDVVTLFSADSNDQTTFGEADRGIAGDLDKLIDDLLASDGVIQVRVDSRTAQKTINESDLLDLEEQMERLRLRYMSQFTAMEAAVDQLTTLKESLTAQFENLPFSNRDN